MITIIPFLDRVSELILNPIISLLFALSFVYFIYGIINFIRLEPGDSKKTEARDAIIWGLVGMLVMFSTYGLISFVLNTFGIQPAEVTPYLQPKL